MLRQHRHHPYQYSERQRPRPPPNVRVASTELAQVGAATFALSDTGARFRVARPHGTRFFQQDPSASDQPVLMCAFPVLWSNAGSPASTDNRNNLRILFLCGVPAAVPKIIKMLVTKDLLPNVKVSNIFYLRAA